MSPKETDAFFIECLKNYLQEKKEEFEYIKGETAEVFAEVKEDFEYIIEDLSQTLASVETIEELADLDEDSIGNVFEYLEEYSDNFVISCDEIQREKDFAEHKKIEELLMLFYDEDEDSAEE